jgi:transcriptional regulator with PAS, ATPase and Fis domain
MNTLSPTLSLTQAPNFELLKSCPSPKIAEVVSAIESSCNARSNIIQGETGVGKELVAMALHEKSSRSKGEFIAVNCADLNKDLIGSEFFGHEAGAFTGAAVCHIGFCEQADNGTLFLDEIGELPLDVQARFLRVFQTNTVRRVGGSKNIQSKFKLIAATNRNLAQMVKERKFRADLYYRINVCPIAVPALRNRVEDIMHLAQHFTHKLSEGIMKIDDSCSARLIAHQWPGNVRELENLIERTLHMSKCEDSVIFPRNLRFDNVIDEIDLSQVDGIATSSHPDFKRLAPTLVNLVRNYGSWKEFTQALCIEMERYMSSPEGGNLSRFQIAKLLGIGRKTIYNYGEKLKTNPETGI